MRILILSCVVAGLTCGQVAPALPADVDAESFSRLPLVKRASLTGEALRVYDAVAGKDAEGNPRPTPPMGPAATSMYSMGVAGPMDLLNKYIRNIVVGPAMY